MIRHALRSSGTFWLPVVRLSGSAFPDGCSEAREDFSPLIGLDPKEEEVVWVPDFTEEALVPPPATVRAESWAAAAAASQRPKRLPLKAQQVENPVEFGMQNFV